MHRWPGDALIGREENGGLARTRRSLSRMRNANHFSKRDAEKNTITELIYKHNGTWIFCHCCIVTLLVHPASTTFRRRLYSNMRADVCLVKRAFGI